MVSLKALVLFAMVAIFGAICAFAQRSEPTRPSEVAEKPKRVFGPYEAITFNPSVIHDVKVDNEGNVFLQLRPEFKDKELVVKISNEKFGSYRTWWHDGLELVSPANAGKSPMGWTDRVQVKARYIEYWMDGQVFLHLMRTDG